MVRYRYKEGFGTGERRSGLLGSVSTSIQQKDSVSDTEVKIGKSTVYGNQDLPDSHILVTSVG